MSDTKSADETKIVIPARLESTRLPGKAMLEVGGRPLIEHAWQNARDAAAGEAMREVIVATDSDEIIEHINGLGGETHKTSSAPTCGTERIAEVASARGWGDETVVINLQCDEPGVLAEHLRLLGDNLRETRADIATLATPLSEADAELPQHVKVVTDARGMALYFSRSRIPHGDGATLSHHVGVYAYRAATLKRFVGLPVCDAERSERLEQLRALHHAMTVHVGRIDRLRVSGVDTDEDLAHARRYFER